MIFRAILLAFGVLACSTAVIMIKEAKGVGAVPLAGYRLVIAAAVLSPLFVRDLRRNPGRYRLSHLRRAMIPGLLMGLHLTSWNVGARLTTTANASLIVNLIPIVTPFLLYLLMREGLNRGELLGTSLAIGGVIFLAAADYQISAERVVGNLICFASMVMFAGYLALGRLNRDFPTVWLYVVPLYLFGGLLCLAAAPLFRESMAVPTMRDLWLVIGLGVVPTVIGHSILNYSLKHIRGQAVSIANLGQFIFAGTMAYFLRAEAPAWTFYAACVLTVGGAVVALRATPDETCRTG